VYLRASLEITLERIVKSDGSVASSAIRSVFDISKMYFRPWKPSEVSERMWSVNLDASISGEYQTIGGHSARPSELLRARMTGTGEPWE
jgi:hypothetical protein